MPTLYETLLAAGIPTDNHESDLYFPDTPETQAILDQFPKQKALASHFLNQGEGHRGDLWFDVPFAFDPWSQQRCPETKV
jgi:hypothetical protein